MSKMLSAEERRRQKELEEARKAGLAAPEVDEEGNAINPHIPEFMAAAPWYLNAEGPSLKHQRNWKEELKDKKVWYDRGAKTFQATKYRKGACENCGSMAHKTKDCMERPRSKGARFTNKNIAADEKVEDIDLVTYDAKRDRWNGYNADEWTRQAERFEKVAELRAEIRKKELLERKFEEAEAEGVAADDDDDGEAPDDADIDGQLQAEEDKVAEEEMDGFAKVEKRVRTAGGGSTGTVRNLRIREDTAKYLLNLDTNSAYYDPKSRSMREDPRPEKDDAQKTFAGDNFIRQTGQVQGFGQLNLFSVQAYEGGQDVHLQATPSQAELAFQQFKQRKEALGKKGAQDVLAKYGNAAAPASDEMRALQATEAYVEYDAAGRVIKGQEVKARSRYEEDVHPNNHTSVWGSWWRDGAWGYACCHQAVKNSYCTGNAGEEADGASVDAMMAANLANKAAEAEEARKKAEAEGKPRLEGHKPKNDLWGTEVDEGLQLDEQKLKEALARAEAAEARGVELDDRKRGYNSLHDNTEVTPEEMEAYRIKRGRGMDDPLTFVNKAKAAGGEGGEGGGGQGGYDYV